MHANWSNGCGLWKGRCRSDMGRKECAASPAILTLQQGVLQQRGGGAQPSPPSLPSLEHPCFTPHPTNQIASLRFSQSYCPQHQVTPGDLHQPP